MIRSSTRRTFLLGSAASAISLGKRRGAVASDANGRPRVALIGAGYQPEVKRRGRGIEIGKRASAWADVTHLCEVDSVAAEAANAMVADGRATVVRDYREVITRDDIDAVLIATPDHWHAKIAIEAMRSGKDVYCEKPVAVTIQEGRWLCDVARQTDRVFQVGTQQRSEYEQRFLKAVALVREGRIGIVRDVHIGLGEGWRGGPFDSQPPPRSLDWNRWLGPAPKTDYIPQRTHRTFRWWYEYAGGQITDWGAHHVDIAQWALGKTDRSPVQISGTGQMNQPLRQGMPTRDDTYNTPVTFDVRCQFDDGVVLRIDSSRNGITFTGDEGRFFVNRGTLEGVPVDRLTTRPLPDGTIEGIYGGEIDDGGQPTSHMQNFFDCMRSRATPVSDIHSHHRTLTTCHLANIAVRLARPLTWSWQDESFRKDSVANGLRTRDYRDGWAIEAGG